MRSFHLNLKGFSFSILTLCYMMASCQQKKQGTAVNSHQKNMAAANFREGEDYLLFERARVVDKNGFDVPVEAFSVLLPKGWTFNGVVDWQAPGSGCDGTYTHFRAQSPAGEYSIEVLPPVLWSWTSNEYARQFNESQPPRGNCYFGDPMDATQYVKNVMAPKVLGNVTVNNINPNEIVAQEVAQNNDKIRTELMRYGASQVDIRQTAVNADVSFPDRSEGMLMCAISITDVTVPNIYNGTYDKNITCQAAKRIVFRYPAGKKDDAMKQLTVILGSYTTNPAWQQGVNSFWKDVREKKQAVHIGKIKMMDAQTREIGRRAIENGNQRLASMDNEFRSWEARQATDDRIHSNFIKTIREVETYRDVNGKVELNSGYNHAWSRGDGTSFIMTNSPNFDPSSVLQDQSWKEMKKVD